MAIRLSLLALAGLAACSTQAEPPSESAKAPPAIGGADGRGERQVYWGEMHLHTSYSYDAWGLMGTKIGPEDAYRFAKGEPIEFQGKTVRRRFPLDFMAVTDHAENMGLLNQLDDPTSALAQSAIGQKILQEPRKSFYMLRQARYAGKTVPGLDPGPALKTTWARQVAAANAHYQPGRFTTFIAYEWSQMAGEGRYNLHRNVFFAGSDAPLPFSSVDSGRPEDLWTYLEKNRAAGRDAIAVPHNANGSNGLMYDWNMSDGRPIDQVYAQRRVLNEPLSEISQNKGQSETIPAISPNDEAANFEVWDVLITQRDRKSDPNGSYVRQAYGRGLIVEGRTGANPYKFGVVGGTDFHNGLTTSDEEAFAGSPGGVDPAVNLPAGDAAKRQLDIIKTPALLDDDAAREGRAPGFNRPLLVGGGALTGVWAETNTREAIFAALKRKETFATSGPRLRVRFFGGWGLVPQLLDAPARLYDVATPMGGDLPARRSGAPSFVYQAVKDPDGASLDKVQVVKVWREGDAYREKIFDVAASDGRRADPRTGRAPPVRNTVDLRTATYDNSVGASVLQGVWKDPEFDAAKPAVYYLRVLQIPTPRWNTYLAVARGLPLPDGAPATIQERAWSSPIWFTPTSASRAGGR